MTLFVHEVHRVVGAAEDEFEAAYRDPGGWMDVLGQGDDARLLYYCHQAHGSGKSYRVVTVTAVADGAAWERVSRRVAGGDLHAWATATDALRHDVTSKVLMPLPWSPVVDVDLSTIPATPAAHESTLFMEDTMWPHRGRLAEYLQAAGSHYVALLSRPEALIRLVIGWQSAFGTGARPEVVLMQAVNDTSKLVRLLATEMGPELRPPGTWMHDALEFRDQWESRLLRTAPWSPQW